MNSARREEQSSLEPAFVLHRRPFSDSRALVDIITNRVGRVTVIARVGNKKSTFSALLQPFRPILVQYQGNAELKLLTRCEELALPVALKGNALFSGFYLNELTQRLWPQNLESTELFSVYKTILNNLVTTDVIEPHLRIFEIKLLNYLGYSIDFDCCFDSEQAIKADEYYSYVPQYGFSLRETDNQLARFHGASLIKIDAFQFDSSTVLSDAKRLMRQALSPYLGAKPLKSRDLFLK
ncbi:DNA repair protein RecO [Flocculibacter collagenilyticus]|uniref:DNA repair protein RecO n=1 Tax=Flocculibacter collagenilyticus TaxID=2744479 RepID=UPI0018F4D736|nr:DNA repair protein RecO [Flocculibacter collagenilyticus]